MPVVYRGDGAWIGRMASGELGVGTEFEERASLKVAGMRPMWPFMEKSMVDCRNLFENRWDELRTQSFPTLDTLLSATITTAWESRSKYWMLLAVNWLVEVGRMEGFERSALTEVRDKVLVSDLIGDELRLLMW